MTPLDYDPLRAHDQALVTKLGGLLGTVQGQAGYVAAVPGIALPVPLLLSVPEEWYRAYALPGVSVRRIADLPAPARALPNFRGEEVSTNPDTPNVLNVAQERPRPLNLLYTVELAAASQAAINALELYLLSRLPDGGYGSALLVDDKLVPFHRTGLRDVSDPAGTDGRVFRKVAEYTVETWLVGSLACEKIPLLLGFETGVVATVLPFADAS